MLEIELKARIFDREALFSKLKTLGTFLGEIQKDDVYYGRENPYLRARIRTQTKILEDSSGKKTKKVERFFTYKKKETRDKIEVNDEKECLVSDDEPLRAFFEDVGLSVVLKKQKNVSSFLVDDITAELCFVPPLGDFLELEILSKTDDEKSVNAARARLLKLLKKLEIPESDIENRYYSELLKELEKSRSEHV